MTGTGRRMRRVWSALAASLLAATLPVAGAWAACADPPGPGVVWTRCGIDGLTLEGVDLSGGQLREISAIRAKLAGSRFVGADLYRAKFIRADLSGAKLTGARLIGADFTAADLRGADLSGTNLRQAQFQQAKLEGADLRGAILDATDFLRADLAGAIWVDGRTCRPGSVGRCN